MLVADDDAGWMTDCLGYLGVTINDRMELEELFHYDVLVTCPPQFNLTFSLPNWSSRPDRTFDVILDDAHTSYRVFLTTVTFSDGHVPVCDADTRYDDVIKSGIGARGWSVSALVSAVAVVSVVAVGAFGYAVLEMAKQAGRCRSPAAADEQEVALTESCLRHPGEAERRRRRRTIVVVRALLRIVFALSFTFTVCLSALYLSQLRRLDDARGLSTTKTGFDAAVAVARDALAAHLSSRAWSDVARVREMQTACDGYVGELAASVAAGVAAAEAPVDRTGSPALRLHRRGTRLVSESLDRLVVEIRRRVNVRLRPIAARFRRVVKQSVASPWFSYARSLFNKSSDRPSWMAHSPLNSSDDVSFLLPREISAFAEFLSIHDVEEVELWHRRFKEG